MKLSRLDACEDWKLVHWCRMQASSPNSQGVNEVGMSTAAPNRAQYSAVECTMASVAVRNIVAPEPQPEPVSCLRSVERDVSFLRSDSRCQQYVSNLYNITLRFLGSEQKGRVSLLKLTFSSHLASLLLRWKTADAVFVVLSVENDTPQTCLQGFKKLKSQTKVTNEMEEDMLTVLQSIRK